MPHDETMAEPGAALSPLARAELVEFAEAAAYADLLRAAPSAFGLTVDETEHGVALFAPKIDILLFNRVIGLGVRTPADRRRCDDLVQRYRAAGVCNFGIQVSAEARPDALAGWLQDAGLQVRDYWTKVYRSPEPAPVITTDLRITAVESNLADVFAATACEGFGMPSALAPLLAASVGRSGWHHYLAWDGDTPAAAAALFVNDIVGWLGVAATVPAFRRRGAQGALMSRRIADAARLGCRWVVTETAQDRQDKPNASFRNMVRAGFVVAYHRPNFMPGQPGP